MKNTKTVFVIFTFLFLLILIFNASNYGAEGAKEDTNPNLEEMFTYAIQDEYLARAEYYMIMEKYGVIRPFSNIVKAEEYHVSLLVPLFEKYGYKVPYDDAKEYVVIPTNLKAAIEIGVKAEIDNIAMYKNFLKQDLPADVQEVFEELKSASGNHLRAFKNNLGKY